ncbi:Protein ltv1 [Entomophthora muscae]|uniref:Protein ltv1 n=1 Tax=Entomophthora muscae TaxID=34485 RepID=A0ACC2SEV8_9FUNG|nr:Protein ltv1 [Entomophthora muscae]
MGKKQFINKKDAQHFTVVHRSQHDPLVADGEASKLVLLPVLPSANLKSKSRSSKLQLDDGLEGEELEKALQDDIKDNAALAAQFGITFGDDYDYLQHLKPMGQSSDAVFVAAPKGAKAQEKAKKSVSFKLPEEALASKDYISVGLMNQPAIPDDYDMCMDPDVIDALEALEDDAFVVDELEQDFFAQMDEEGQHSDEEEEGLDEFSGWEEHFRKFQKERTKAGSDDGSEGDEKFKHVGRRTSASKYSMTSSAMFRNKGLALVDEQFERMMEQYDENTDDEEDDCPQLVLREDFAAVADDFLENFEVVGRRMVPRMEGETSTDKFDRMRRSLIASADTKKHIQNLVVDEDPLPEIEQVQEEAREARWDCESILSTYSNIYNRPALITETSTKIRINSRGFPRLETIPQEEEESESDEEKIRLDNSRVKGETSEEKKARKQLAKDLKRERREQKKANKALHQQLDRQRQTTRKLSAATHQKAIPLE